MCSSRAAVSSILSRNPLCTSSSSFSSSRISLAVNPALCTLHPPIMLKQAKKTAFIDPFEFTILLCWRNGTFDHWWRGRFSDFWNTCFLTVRLPDQMLWIMSSPLQPRADRAPSVSAWSSFQSAAGALRDTWVLFPGLFWRSWACRFYLNRLLTCGPYRHTSRNRNIRGFWLSCPENRRWIVSASYHHQVLSWRFLGDLQDLPGLFFWDDVDRSTRLEIRLGYPSLCAFSGKAPSMAFKVIPI